MIEITNECVCCAAVGLYCLGDSCPNLHVTRCYCDKCGEEIEPDELCEPESGVQLCGECMEEMYGDGECD